MNAIQWQKINEIFTAEDLMTPRSQLYLAERKDGIDPVPSDAQEFDIIPVVEKDRLVGVLEKGTSAMQYLTDCWLISRDTGIPDLVCLFAQTGQRAFLVLHKQDVIGLVSPADLNKLPARVYIYNLIGELELVFMMLIEEHFGNREDLIYQLLSENRQEGLRDISNKLQEGNADVGLIQQLYLSDLINIMVKEPILRNKIGFTSRKQAENTLGGLNDLRAQTMHLVRPLLEKVPEDLDQLHQRINRAVELLEKLNNNNPLLSD
jgi:hypothetical protein